MDDNTHKKNPLWNPPSDVLRAILLLESDYAFGQIRKWLEVSFAYFSQRLPYGKDEVNHRWNQGHVQVLNLIITAFSKARKELESRDKNLKENQIPRNV